MYRFVEGVPKPLNEVSVHDIRRFLTDEEETRGNSLGTIATKIARLRSLFGWLHKEELIGRDPTTRLEVPVLPKQPPKYLTHEEIELLREAATGLDRVILELLYSTGLRRTEAVNLDWDDIDFTNRTVRVREGKGGKDRLVLLSTRAAMLLERYKGLRNDENPWVLQSQFRRRMSKENINRRMRCLGEKAGLKERLTPHRLRHSLATHLLSGGMPLDQVQMLLGHASVRSTQHYARTQIADVNVSYRRVIP